MYLDYSNIKLRTDGRPEYPVLRLKTLSGLELGPVSNAYGIQFEINYASLSTIQFSVPHYVDGTLNPSYAKVLGHRVVWTECYGIYILMNPSITGDGLSEVKEVTGYSLEQIFENKNLFLQEGTYNFWNPASQEDTILARIIEKEPTWTVGYVAPALIGRYRTFDQYDGDVLNFCYSDALEKFRAVFVFDVYEKTINVYDADQKAETLPIYLSYQNLVEEVNVSMMCDEMATQLHIYGADDLSIRDVNPAGTDYLVDLSYFIANGDLDCIPEGSTETLASRVQNWQRAILNRQAYYTGLVGMRASKTAEKLAEEVALADLNSELEVLTAQQSVTIQALAMETTDSGIESQQALLDEINEQIRALKDKIEAQEAVVEELEQEIASYNEQIAEVNGEVAFEHYFTEEEQRVLNLFLIEGTVTEETFVATDVDTTASGTSESVEGNLSVEDGAITRIAMGESSDAVMYAIKGGALTMEDAGFSGEVIQGTLEVHEDAHTLVFSAYVSGVSYDEAESGSGVVTVSGSYTSLGSDVAEETEDGITEEKGTYLQVALGGRSLFFTANVSDYQKYAVAKELYDYGATVLAESAHPVYEFSLNSANFLFQKVFEPFKNALELGKAVYLYLASEGNIQANVIGMSFSFDDLSDFSLTFSNQYQRRDGVVTLRDMIQSSYSSSRSFDANKYIYNQTVGQANQVSDFMNGSINAAVNTIVGAENQSVVINGAGIHVGGDSNYQIRIVDSMICMTDDNWQTAKLAIGRFASPETGEYWGVNADVLGGKLLIGNSMILENTTEQGVVQFRVDGSGAWLYNSTFVLASDRGGKLLLSPEYGMAAGTGNLYQTSGAQVTPSFLDEDGELILDGDGMPEHANFYLDPRDGSAYFRGRVYATEGRFTGDVYARNFYFQDGDDVKTLLDEASKKFDLSELDYIDLGGIQLDGTTGDITMAGNLNLSSLSSITWGNFSPVKYQFSTSESGPWHDEMQSDDKYRRDSLDGGITWGTPYQFRGEDGENGSDANVPDYITRTYIDGTRVEAPVLRGGKIEGADVYGGAYWDLDGNTRLVLNPTGSSHENADLNLYRGDTVVWQIYDGISYASWRSYDNLFLVTSGSGTSAMGDWDFSGANVSGAFATFG